MQFWKDDINRSFMRSMVTNRGIKLGDPPDIVSLTSSWGGNPIYWSPFAQVTFFFYTLGIISTLVMATLNLPNLTLGIPLWYLDPPTPLGPSKSTPYFVLTPMYPIGVTPLSAKKSTQTKLVSTKSGKGVGTRGKIKKYGATNVSG
jgi:hypothetical protein